MTVVWGGSVQAPGLSLSHRLPTLVVWLSFGLRSGQQMGSTTTRVVIGMDPHKRSVTIERKDCVSRTSHGAGPLEAHQDTPPLFLWRAASASCHDAGTDW